MVIQENKIIILFVAFRKWKALCNHLYVVSTMWMNLCFVHGNKLKDFFADRIMTFHISNVDDLRFKEISQKYGNAKMPKHEWPFVIMCFAWLINGS